MIRGEMKVSELAAALGVTGQYIYDLEAGRKVTLSDTMTKLISLQFNVSREWLLTGNGTMECPIGEAVMSLNDFEAIIAAFEDQYAASKLDLPANKKALMIKLICTGITKFRLKNMQNIREYIQTTIESLALLKL